MQPSGPQSSDGLDPIDALGRAAADCNGDVLGLVARGRAQDPAFEDDGKLAATFERAAARRGAAGDRVGTWWLACATATLRDAGIASPQEEAELCAARCLGELVGSAVARGPLPLGAQWLVGGAGAPAPSASTLALAHRNAMTHLERLDAELAGREPLVHDAVARAHDPEVRRAIDEALSSYVNAVRATRAALVRVGDHLVAISGDGALGGTARSAVLELDEVAGAALLERVGRLRAAVGLVAPRRTGRSATFSSVDIPAVPRDVGALESAMRAAYEHAWGQPSPATRAAFEQAVRARYEVEVEAIDDPAERAAALEHYVQYAMAQIPS
jgi:hypothetical protein